MREIIKKIVLIGDQAVGKTSIHRNYMGKKYDTEYLPTLGADFSHLELIQPELKDTQINLSIWDLAGQPNYDSVRPFFYRGADAAILVYDITREETIVNLEYWIDDLYSVVEEQIPLFMVGNKEDLRKTGQSKVSSTYHDNFQIKLEKSLNMKVPGYVTSAKTGLHIKELFSHMLEIVTADIIP